MTPPISRRDMLATGAAAVAAAGAMPAFAQAPAAGAVRTKPIPVSKEALPVIGIGTAVIFDYENDPVKQAERAEVLRVLTAGGGSLIDTAPAYGKAEDRLGEVMASTGTRAKIFLATKVAARSDRAGQIAQMEASKVRLKSPTFDLMQAWNVTEATYDLGLIRDWKAQKICRYTGITSSQDAAYAALEQVIRREKPDFFQINYSLADRDAEARLLPAAMDSGCAVLTNTPFGRNSMFAKVAGRPLPDFAREFDAATWPQYFLKFLLSHPAVTAVIPGTDKPQYMTDNLAAGRGRLPDAAMRQRMIDHWATM